MLAIVGGLGAAAAFAAATLCSSRSTRLIGPSSVLAWVMLVGLSLTGPLAIRDGLPAQLVGGSFGWVVLAGCGNVLGLLLGYAGLRIGHVGLVAPILSAEGALAAVISFVAGEPIALGMGATLGLVAIGIGLAGLTRREHTELAVRDDRRAALYALAAALAFGASLYATGRLGAELLLAWVLPPARLVGVLVVGVPLALTRRLRLSRRAAAPQARRRLRMPTPTAMVATPATCTRASRSRKSRNAITPASAPNCDARTALMAIPSRAPSVNRPKPATSQSPEATTMGSARRERRRRRVSARGIATTTTPTSRAGSSTQASGNSAPRRPVAYRLAPNASAAASA